MAGRRDDRGCSLYKKSQEEETAMVLTVNWALFFLIRSGHQRMEWTARSQGRVFVFSGLCGPVRAFLSPQDS